MAVEARIADGPSWLIAGLGNPGPEYERTYHNLGFLAIDRLGARANIRLTRPECKALVGAGVVAGQPVVLAKPQTFMNLSGGSIQPLLQKYTLPPERLILIYDELALDWGSLRIRLKGSAVVITASPQSSAAWATRISFGFVWGYVPAAR